MRKSLFIFTLLLALVGSIAAQTDTIYVWNHGGLNLRASASMNGDIVKTLSFGAKLVILEDTTERASIKQKVRLESYCPNKDPFYVEGRYIKVKSGEDVGYIYDGFTCSIPTPPHGFIAYHDFFKSHYGTPEVASIDDSINHMNLWYQYDNGFAINYRSDFGGRIVHYTIVLKGMTANDAFLIVDHFEKVRCAKQEDNTIWGNSKYLQFSTSNENVSEGSAVIIEHRDKVMIEIQQDWE
jgi:hypothetical protein